MKGSNVTVCPFVVQESYLRNTYIHTVHTVHTYYSIIFPLSVVETSDAAVLAVEQTYRGIRRLEASL